MTQNDDARNMLADGRNRWTGRECYVTSPVPPGFSMTLTMKEITNAALPGWQDTWTSITTDVCFVNIHLSPLFQIIMSRALTAR